VLVFTALGSDDDRTKALSFRALELVAVGPLLATGMGCPGTHPQQATNHKEERQ
jgi:hypothetical protein